MFPFLVDANAEPPVKMYDSDAIVSYLWRTVPCPVIAAVHGVCIGGGFQIALGADVRVAAA